MLDNAFEKKSASRNGETVSKGVTSRALPLKGNYASPDSENVDIFRLLDELEDLLEKAKRLPFRTLFRFDEEKFYYLVMKIRANLPEDMKKAQRVARDTERIVEEARDTAAEQMESVRMEAKRVVDNAHSEAARIVEQAQQQATQSLSQSEINQMATVQARDILAQAETEAQEIRRGADDYAREVLTSLEAVMGKAITTVQRGRETLDNART